MCECVFVCVCVCVCAVCLLHVFAGWPPPPATMVSFHSCRLDSVPIVAHTPFNISAIMRGSSWRFCSLKRKRLLTLINRALPRLERRHGGFLNASRLNIAKVKRKPNPGTTCGLMCLLASLWFSRKGRAMAIKPMFDTKGGFRSI